MTGKITPRKKRELAKKGLSTGQIDHMDRVVRDAPSGMAPNPPMDKDSLLMQPLENWEESDKRPPGRKKFFHGGSKRFRENLAKIDWEA